MLIKLIEVKKEAEGIAHLSEIFVNSTHIISVSEESFAHELIKENLGLADNVVFSSVLLSEGYRTRKVTVVGTPAEINTKVKRKQVLRG